VIAGDDPAEYADRRLTQLSFVESAAVCCPLKGIGHGGSHGQGQAEHARALGTRHDDLYLDEIRGHA